MGWGFASTSPAKGAALAAGAQTGFTGTVLFSNSNNVSFGMTNSSIITASASFSQSIAPAAISAGTTLANSGTIVFANANNVSFGMNNGTITATVTSPSGAPFAISAGTTSASSGTLVLSNSNGLSFGMNGQTITGSYTQSTAPAAISAGTTLASSGTIIFTNGNNVSFGVNGNTVSGSVASSIGGLGANNVIPQFTSNGSYVTTSPFSVGTDNRLLIGSNFIQIGSTSPPGTPPAGNLVLYAATEQGGFDRFHLIDDTGLVVHANQDVLFIVRNTSGSSLPIGTPVYYTGSTGNTPNVSPARANSKTTMVAIGVTVEVIANNGFGRIMSLGRLVNVDTSAFTEGDTLYVSATVAGGLTNVPPVPPNLTQRVGIVVKASNSGIIDVRIFAAKGDELGTQEDSYQIGEGAGAKSLIVSNNVGQGVLAWNPSANRTISLPDANGTVALLSNIGVTALSAGSTAITSGQAVFSNANGVSFGANGQTITASATYAPVLQFWENLSGVMMQQMTFSTLSIVPLAANIFPGLMTATQFCVGLNGVSVQSTASGAMKFSFGLYTLNGQSLSLFNSATTSFSYDTAASASQNYLGFRWLTLDGSQWSNQLSFSQTNYWLGLMVGTQNATQSLSWLGQNYANAQGRWGTIGVPAIAPAGSLGWRPLMGAYTATTSALPSAISQGDLNASFTNVGNFLPHVILNNVMASF